MNRNCLYEYTYSYLNNLKNNKNVKNRKKTYNRFIRQNMLVLNNKTLKRRTLCQIK